MPKAFYLEINKEMLDLLDVANIFEIEVRFAGGGDSGEVTYTDVLYKDGVEKLPKEEENALVAKAEELAYRLMDQSHVDWYNDEGGTGLVCIRLDDVAGWVADVEVSQYHLKPVYGTSLRLTVKDEEEET